MQNNLNDRSHSEDVALKLDPIVRRRFRNDLQDRIAHRISLMDGDVSHSDVRKLINDMVREAVDGTESFDTLNLGTDTREQVIEFFSQEFASEFLGYGPLDKLLEHPEGITEIMVNPTGITEDGTIGPHEVWIEREGRLYLRDDIKFEDNDHVNRVMNRICSRQGRHIDDANPNEDATLPDGSRFNGTVYPVCPDGSTFNIRLFSDDALSAKDLLASNSCSKAELEFLSACVAARCSILISGGTGAGKTTLLNVLSEYIPKGERIVTIEDTCELLVRKHHSHVVRLEGRKPNSEGQGEVTLDDLLRNTLRKRPDRIVIGECRGVEAYTMLEAMNTGHDGSMTTIHANDPSSAITRLVTLVKQGDSTLSEDTIRTKIADALDLIVQVSRLSDGTRKIVAIEHVGDHVDGHVQHDCLFRWQQEGVTSDGRVIGTHEPCCVQPRGIREKIETAGLAYNTEWFIPEGRG